MAQKGKQCRGSSVAAPVNGRDMIDINSVMVGLVGFVTFMLVLSYGKYAWRRKKMPPGPVPLPILGNFLQLQSEGLVPSLIKLAEKFGPIYTIYMGSRPTVILTGYQTVKEALVDMGDAFLNRGSLPIFDRIFNYRGLTFINGDSWKQLRQFSLMTLKDFGMGKKSLEEPIQAEAQHLVEHFISLNEQPFDPSTTLTCASSNISSNILMGTRHDYNDKKWMKILEDSCQAFHIVSSIWGQFYDMFPKIMPYLPGPHRKIFSLLKPLEDVVKESIRTHQETLDPACPRDFMDCFLIRMKQEEKNFETSFDMANLKSTIFDMFLGGAESTSVTVNFGFLILIKYPELQDKLHEEIDQVIGQIRQPSVEDRNKMPYMNALLHEIQRYSDVFPMGIVRSTTRDVPFHGYCIPKGTDVLPVLTTVLRDPSQFESPGDFNIKHFLDESGKFKKNNGFLPFSAGKRSCVAESLVRLQLFIFFTVILQKFTMKSIMDPKDLDISPTESGLENLPPVHKFIFISRV
ncbi:cytochrome P450 2A4-like isoform X1 [Mixophyes fleayi]|uniref:cytochrome P450 2A4-like isoform X1 n=1 Tax=Mixophyes fleayi TaxID=3061075 RepID=UPI003F4E028C